MVAEVLVAADWSGDLQGLNQPSWVCGNSSLQASSTKVFIVSVTWSSRTNPAHELR